MILQNGILFSGISFPFNPLPVALILAIIVSYLLGSINSAVLVSRIFYKEDIRQRGSGNAGLTNTVRVYGKRAGALVLLGDVLKTVLALLFSALLFGFHYYASFSVNPLMYISAVAAVLGHSYPVYFKFKGGKGVLSTATVALVLSPLAFAIGILIFLIMLFGFKYVSLASLTVAFFYPFLIDRLSALLGVRHDLLTILATVFLGIFIFYTHRSNIKRLMSHTENKVSFKRKDKSETE